MDKLVACANSKLLYICLKEKGRRNEQNQRYVEASQTKIEIKMKLNEISTCKLESLQTEALISFKHRNYIQRNVLHLNSTEKWNVGAKVFSRREANQQAVRGRIV